VQILRKFQFSKVIVRCIIKKKEGGVFEYNGAESSGRLRAFAITPVYG
jgi:hypothetical protein